jgi:hypothetical protein
VKATACQSLNQSGSPCSAAVWQGGYCRWHHPDLVQERVEWSRRGGQARSNTSRAKKALGDEAMTIGEVRALLCRALRKVEGGELEPGPANSMAALGRAIAALTETFGHEERLVELERLAGLERRGA